MLGLHESACACDCAVLEGGEGQVEKADLGGAVDYEMQFYNIGCGTLDASFFGCSEETL